MNDIAPSKADRGSRIAILMLEGVAGFVALAFLLVGLLFGRLAAGPMETGLLTPYIESALSDGARGLTAEIAQSQLLWDRDSRQLELRLEGTVLSNLKDEPVIALPAASVRISALRVLLGKIEVTEVQVNGANIRLERLKDGRLSFYGVEPLPDPSPVPPPLLTDTIGSFPDMLANLNNGLSHLRRLSISAVEVALIDRQQASATPQSITLPDLELKRDGQGRLVGGAQAKIELEPHPLILNLAVNMLPTDGVGEVKLGWEKLDLSTLGGLAPELAGLSEVALPLTGMLTLTYSGNKKQSPILMALEVDAEAGSIQLPGLLPDKVQVKSAHAVVTAKASVAGGIESASLQDLSIDLNGSIIAGAVDLMPAPSPSIAKQDSFTLPANLVKGERRALTVNITAKQVDVDRLGSLWAPQLAAGARDWVVNHLRGGTAPEATFKMAAIMDWPSMSEMSIAELGGTIAMSGVTVDYLPELPPITNTAATATFDATKMKIDISDGTMNGVQLQPSTAVIDLASSPENLTIEAKGSGPLPRIMEAIDKKPLGYPSRMGIATDALQGDADFTLKLAFPLLADLLMEQVQLGLEGTIRNFASDKIVDGLKLSGGTLIVALDTSNMSLSGPLTINGAAATLNWKEVFDPGSEPGSTALVTTEITNRLLENLGAGPVDYVVGALPATVRYERFAQGGDTIDLNVDLKAGGLKLTPIGYERRAGEAGKLTAKMKLPASKAKNQAIQITSLSATGDNINLQGKGTLLQRPLRIQSINVARGEFAGSRFTANLSRLGETGWQGSVNASELNIAALQDPNDKSPAERLPPLDLTVTADKAIFAADRSVSPLKVVAKHNGAAWQQLEIDLKAKDTPFSFRLVPAASGGQSLTINTTNLGTVLYQTDLTDTILGGRLMVEGSSKAVGDKITSRIDLRDFRIRNVPFIASLISAISAEGLLNALSRGEGLSFSRLRGDIDWQGDNVTLNNVKTSGGALGLTIEGDVNTFKETVDLHGTAVPFNSVNSLLGNVPIVGQILGGSSGVFAATYTARGPFDDIRVSVNPLSILAPGFLRDLFFIEG